MRKLSPAIRGTHLVPWALSLAAILGLMALALVPIWDRIQATEQVEMMVSRAEAKLDRTDARPVCLSGSPESVLHTARIQPVLASWGNVGGCGVGGGAATGGGVKWVGRGVTGGLVDFQCTGTQAFFLDGAEQFAFNARIGTSYFNKWAFAVNLPFLYKVDEVDVFGESQRTFLPGFADLGLELTRKLGITTAHSLTLSLTAPTGPYDAVRKGVILPQRQQLGSGVMSTSLTYEYSQDQDWGLLIYGGNLSYGGWENKIGDMRASSASGYVYVGYLLGPLVPAVGMTLTGKFLGDQERYITIEGQPYFLMTPTGLEAGRGPTGLRSGRRRFSGIAPGRGVARADPPPDPGG